MESEAAVKRVLRARGDRDILGLPINGSLPAKNVGATGTSMHAVDRVRDRTFGALSMTIHNSHCPITFTPNLTVSSCLMTVFPRQDIRASARRLWLLVHPDKTRAEGATEAFRKVKGAEEALLLQVSRRPPSSLETSS